jgi:hypothetical protein
MVRAILNACQEIVAKNPGNYDIAYIPVTACLILSYHSKKHLLLLKKEGRMPKDYLA